MYALTSSIPEPWICQGSIQFVIVGFSTSGVSGRSSSSLLQDVRNDGRAIVIERMASGINLFILLMFFEFKFVYKNTCVLVYLTTCLYVYLKTSLLVALSTCIIVFMYISLHYVGHSFCFDFLYLTMLAFVGINTLSHHIFH